jgi:hypothetical protein
MISFYLGFQSSSAGTIAVNAAIGGLDDVHERNTRNYGDGPVAEKETKPPRGCSA